MPDINPLTDSDLADIEQSLSDLQDVKSLQKRMEMAGIDVTESKKTLFETESKLTKLKNAFFPNR